MNSGYTEKGKFHHVVVEVIIEKRRDGKKIEPLLQKKQRRERERRNNWSFESFKYIGKICVRFLLEHRDFEIVEADNIK